MAVSDTMICHYTYNYIVTKCEWMEGSRAMKGIGTYEKIVASVGSICDLYRSMFLKKGWPEGSRKKGHRSDITELNDLKTIAHSRKGTASE